MPYTYFYIDLAQVDSEILDRASLTDANLLKERKNKITSKTTIIDFLNKATDDDTFPGLPPGLNEIKDIWEYFYIDLDKVDSEISDSASMTPEDLLQERKNIITSNTTIINFLNKATDDAAFPGFPPALTTSRQTLIIKLS